MPKVMKNAARPTKVKNTFKVEEPKPFPLLEDKEWYTGKFTKHEITDGLYGKTVKMFFKILGGELTDGNSAKGLEASALMSAELAEGKKFYDFAVVLEGHELEVNDVVDLSAHYGTVLRVFNEQKEQKATGKVYNNITAIKRRPKKG